MLISIPQKMARRSGVPAGFVGIAPFTPVADVLRMWGMREQDLISPTRLKQSCDCIHSGSNWRIGGSSKEQLNNS
jgi:hypothetical protein